MSWLYQPLPAGGQSDAAADKPFAQTDWPLPIYAPRTHDLRTWINNGALVLLLAAAPAAPPFAQSEWPLPSRAPRSIDLWTHVDQTKRLLIGQDQLPHNQTEWPVTNGPKRESSLVVFLQTGFLTLSVGPVKPTAQLDWPVPPGAPQGVITNKTHLDQTKRLLIGADRLPKNQFDWPVPKGPQSASDLGFIAHGGIVTRTTNPNAQYDWPVPPGSAPGVITNRSHLDPLKRLLIGKDAVVLGTVRNYDWPVPKGPQRALDLITWIQTSTAEVADELQPNSQYDWPVPKGYIPVISLGTHLDPTRINLIGRDQLPKNQFDWPVTKGAIPSIDLRTHVDQTKINLIGQDRLPFRELDWPNPTLPAVRDVTLLSWWQTLGIDTRLLQFRAFFQTDWPVPSGYVPGISLRTHIDQTRVNLIGKDRLPFSSKSDQPNPRGRFIFADHQQGLINPLRLHLATPPIRQADWPVPYGRFIFADDVVGTPQTLTFFTQDPFNFQPDWPVPYCRFIFADFISGTPAQLVQVSLFPPISQIDWPNPTISVPRMNPDWIAGWSNEIRAIVPIRLGPGFVEIAPNFAPVAPPEPRRHRVERELDRLHLRRIIERAYATQKQPVEQIVAYLTQLAVEGQIDPLEFLLLLHAQLPHDMIDVDALVAEVEASIIARRAEIEERDIEAILLALGDL